MRAPTCAAGTKLLEETPPGAVYLPDQQTSAKLPALRDPRAPVEQCAGGGLHVAAVTHDQRFRPSRCHVVLSLRDRSTRYINNVTIKQPPHLTDSLFLDDQFGKAGVSE
jgi:hypothetical protein